MNHRSECPASPRRIGTRIAPLIAGCLAVAASMPALAADEGPALDSSLERVSYGIGLRIGVGLREQGLDEIDAAALATAIEDVLNRRKPRINQEEMKAAQEGYQASRAAATGQQAAANLVAGRAFLASNAENEGVVQTPDGLQYRILRTGSGAKPAADDRVVVHYRGRLIDGTEFDSSYRRGEPIEFMVGAVIPGWQAALQAMPAGSHWEVWIPAALAYGERGAGGIIGPNQALHFEIDLIEIKPEG